MNTLPTLLERAGATIRGRRADCPTCGGKQSVAIDAERGLYCCHRFGCGFHGGAAGLARQLGIAVALPPRAAVRPDMNAAQRRAEAIWDAAQPAPVDYPYLHRKGVQPHGARLHGETLCLAARNADGFIRTLQFIAPDGGKRFLKGASPKGCMYPIQGRGGRIWVCEGFATAATIHELTGRNAVAAFSAGNLEAVAVELRRGFPDTELLIAADNDHRTAGNPGIAAAKAAARAAGCRAVWPLFPTGSVGTDWNDYSGEFGADAAREALREVRAL